MKNIYFVRHGEAEGNVSQTTQTPATPLTEKGLEQAVVVAERLNDLRLTALYASPFTRAQQTAEKIAEKINLPVQTMESVHELIKPTSLAGVRHYDELQNKYFDAWRANCTNPDWKFEDEESFTEVYNRCKETYDFILAETNTSIAIVSHGNFIKLFLLYVLLQKHFVSTLLPDTLYNSAITNTGITHFFEKNGQLFLHTYNDRAHFAE